MLTLFLKKNDLIYLNQQIMSFLNAIAIFMQ